MGKKSRSTKKQKSQSLPRPPPQVNPFYIEQENTWEGDCDWRKDEEIEHEGLLESGGGGGGRNETRRGRSHRRLSHTRLGLIALGVFFFFLFVLSLSGSANRSDVPPGKSDERIHIDSDGNETGGPDTNVTDSALPNSTATGNVTEVPSINETFPSASPTSLVEEQITPSPSTASSTNNMSSLVNVTSETPTPVPLTNVTQPKNLQPSQPQAAGTSAPTHQPSALLPADPPTSKPVGVETSAPSLLEVASSTDEPEPIISNSPSPEEESTSISRLVILGERHSGVQRFQTLLMSCFPSLNVTTQLTREASWFQADPSPEDAEKFSLLVAVRNPYDWVQAMLREPLYMPAHMDLELLEFCAAPWTMPRPEQELDLDADTTCQLSFRFDQVIPCAAVSLNTSNPIYELDSSGVAFDNILDLRANKIRHWMHEVPSTWAQHIVGDPFAMLVERRFEEAVTQVALMTGLSPNCPEDGEAAKPLMPASPLRMLRADFVEWMNNHVQWEFENEIGYDRGST